MLAPLGAHAEPYFAVRQGLKCVTCHVNPTGGACAMRSANWSQTVCRRARSTSAPTRPGMGEITRYLAVGGNLRRRRLPHAHSERRFAILVRFEELRAYVDVRVIPDRLSLYIDQRLAPGSSTNAEAYGRFWFGNQRYYVKAGQIVPAVWTEASGRFGLRPPGAGHQLRNADRGVEFGLETAAWSAQVAGHEWLRRRTGNGQRQAAEPQVRAQ